MEKIRLKYYKLECCNDALSWDDPIREEWVTYSMLNGKTLSTRMTWKTIKEIMELPTTAKEEDYTLCRAEPEEIIEYFQSKGHLFKGQEIEIRKGKKCR